MRPRDQGCGIDAAALEGIVRDLWGLKEISTPYIQEAPSLLHTPSAPDPLRPTFD